MPTHQLLVFDVREGWEPLCKFLDLPVPDIPFPNVNDKRQLAVLNNIIHLISWITVLGVPLLLFGALFLESEWSGLMGAVAMAVGLVYCGAQVARVLVTNHATQKSKQA